MTAEEAERLVPEQRVFIQRIRRGADIMDATSDTTIQSGDIVAVAGRRDVLTSLIGTAAEEVDDRESAGGAGRGPRRLRHQQTG